MEQYDMTSLLSKLNGPEGKQLIALMKKDGGAAFKKAAAAARTGDYQQAMSILQPILEGTEAEHLAHELSKDNG